LRIHPLRDGEEVRKRVKRGKSRRRGGGNSKKKKGRLTRGFVGYNAHRRGPLEEREGEKRGKKKRKRRGKGSGHPPMRGEGRERKDNAIILF